MKSKEKLIRSLINIKIAKGICRKENYNFEFNHYLHTDYSVDVLQSIIDAHIATIQYICPKKAKLLELLYT